jgi:hypothetical protein
MQYLYGRTLALTLKMSRVRAAQFVGVQGFESPLSPFFGVSGPSLMHDVEGLRRTRRRIPVINVTATTKEGPSEVLHIHHRTQLRD